MLPLMENAAPSEMQGAGEGMGDQAAAPAGGGGEPWARIPLQRKWGSSFMLAPKGFPPS